MAAYRARCEVTRLFVRVIDEDSLSGGSSFGSVFLSLDPALVGEFCHSSGSSSSCPPVLCPLLNCTWPRDRGSYGSKKVRRDPPKSYYSEMK